MICFIDKPLEMSSAKPSAPLRKIGELEIDCSAQASPRPASVRDDLVTRDDILGLSLDMSAFDTKPSLPDPVDVI